MDFTIWASLRVKMNENEKIEKLLDLVKELKKNAEHESTRETNCSGEALNDSKDLEKKTGERIETT